MGVVLFDDSMDLGLGVGLGVLPFRPWLGQLVFDLTLVEINLACCFKGGLPLLFIVLS